MTYLYVVLALAAVLAIARVAIALRRSRSQDQQDWDARLVQNLRAAGGNSFTPYEVDFFFGLPDEAACSAVRGILEPEGFAVDARAAVGEAASGYSLHARKHLRISVGEMQEHSKRFRALAEQFGGNYDGWMTDPSRK
jgi:histidinol-phosphate/aromatic aminotransferase/cobyric acid decarboxylase-like protein